jgi:tetratricopeptide (TPR) repeat protein
MATKEVMATAPLVALLYDRTFLAGGFREAFRRRWILYAGFAGTWVLLAVLVFGSHGRAGSAGFGTAVPWHAYALTQVYAVARYLQLSLIPYPLVFDYGSSMIGFSRELALCGLLLLCLVAATIWALIRRPALGFLGASFFMILAPSSSVIPVVTEAMAEHRMYLSLAPVSVLFVLSMDRLLGKGMTAACLVLAAFLSVATWQRNETYGSVVGIWEDTVQRRPENARAHNNLGTALGADPQHVNEAISEYEEALRIDPGFADAHFNLACDLDLVPGRRAEAIEHYEAAIRLKPETVGAHYNLACDLDTIPGERDEAIAHYRKAIELEPDYAEAHYNLGGDLAVSGHLPEAIEQFKEAIRVKPAYADAHFNLGVAYNNSPGHSDEAIREFSEAVRLQPDNFMAHFALARDLAQAQGRLSEARQQYAEALRIQPAAVGVLLEAAAAAAKAPDGRAEAAGYLERILKLEPGNRDAEQMLEGLRGTR